MMGATSVSSGAAASGYYKTEGYYLEGSKEGAEAASWFGEQAAALGLEGRVDDEMFSALLDGQTFEVGKDGPVVGRLMGRYVDGERQHRPGLDLTFSAPKDVSVAALVYGDERLIAAHDAAVKEALGYIEEHAIQTRRRVNGEIVVETGGKMIAGIFRHDTSRAMDPQLHSHAVVANMVRNSSGEYTALHNDLVFKAQKIGSEIYRASLAKAATELGYTVERYGKDRLISLKEIPTEVSDQYSKRRDAILNALDDRGLQVDAKTAERAALATRASKAGGIDREELRQSWQNEAKDLGIDQDAIDKTLAAVKQRGVSRLGGHTREGTASTPAMDAVRQGIAHLSETAVSFGEKQLVEASLRLGRNVDFKEVETAIKSAYEAKVLLPAASKGKDDKQVTTQELIITEKQIVQEWRTGKAGTSLIGGNFLEGRARSAEGALERKVSRVESLSEGQRDAIVVGLTGKSRFVGVQGSAGTGKTYMLTFLTKYAKEHGLHVEGLAPSNRAVSEMKEALPDTETVQARLMRGAAKGKRDIAPAKTIIVVDESSMLTNDQALKLMRQARSEGIGRVVFLGDTAQLDGVGAGTPFALLQKSGMRTAVMDDVIRQRDGNLKEVVGHAIAGEVREAFAKLSGHISQQPNIAEGAAKSFLALSPTERESSGILTPSNRVRTQINEEVRKGLKAEGAIGAEDHQIKALDSLRLSTAERSDPRSYDQGDVIIAHQSVKTAGITKGHIYEVAARDDKTVTLTRVSDGTSIEITPTPGSKIAASIEVFQRGERDFSEGENVKFRISDKDHEIANGMRGKITDIQNDSVTVKDTDGVTHTLPRDSLAAQGMDKAHALTVHDMQGASVKHPIMALSSGEHFANLKSFYVGVSRSVDDFELVTDNVAKLKERVTEQTGETPTALEAYVEAARERGEMASKASDRASQEERREPTEVLEKVTENKGSERDRPAPEIDSEKDQEKSRSIAERKDEIDQTFAEERAEIMKSLNQKIRQERER